MGKQIGSLYASMSLESASFVNNLDKAVKSTQRATSAIENGMSRMGTAVKGFVAVWAANKSIDTAAKYLEIADSSKKMEAQLKLATAQFGNMGAAERDVQAIAKETRTGLMETTSLYAKFLPAARDLGKGQTDAARATETFTKALQIGGAGTAEAASATLQFGQALASGVLRGDEFNSVNEASPRIMRLLADSMGVPVGALRKMAEEGKLTSDVLFKALTDRKFTAAIDEEFSELPKTFDQAKTLMTNSLMTMIGEFDRGAGISAGIVRAMGDGEEAMDLLSKTAFDTGADIRANFAALYDVFQPILAGGTDMFDQLGVQAMSFRERLSAMFKDMDAIANKFIDLNNWATRTDNKAKSWLNERLKAQGFSGDSLYQKKPEVARSDMAGRYDRGYQKSQHDSARQNLIATVRKYGSDKSFTGKGMTDAQLLAHAKGMQISGSTTGSGKRVSLPGTAKPKKGGGGQSSAEKAAREAAREAEKDRRNNEAFNSELSRAQLSELDSRQAIASTAAERFALDRESLETEHKARLARIDAEGPDGAKRYSAAQVADLKAVQERIATNERLALTLKEQEFKAAEQLKLSSASLDNASEVAQLQSGLARTAKDRRAAELRLLDLQMEQEKLALDAIVASKTATDAEKQVAQARLNLLPTLRQLGERKVNNENKGPIGSYLDAIPRTADEINEAMERVQVDGLSRLEDGLTDTIMGVGNLGDAFKDLTKTIIGGLARIAIQQAIVKPLGEALFGGGKSGGGGIFGSIFAGLTKAVSPKVGKANGGIGNRGQVLVGEHGPEVLTMGGPYHVTPNSKLKEVQGNAGGVTVNFGPITSNDPAAIRRAATEAIAAALPTLNRQASDATLGRLRRPLLT